MRRYNIWRPVILILTAVLTNSLVTNLSLVFGLSQDMASNLGFGAMMVAAIIMYTRMTKHHRK